MDRTAFHQAIKASSLGSVSSKPMTATEMFGVYQSTLSKLADQFAPAHKITQRRQPLTPWYDAECRSIRRKCRLFERRYKRTLDPADREAWVRELKAKHSRFNDKEEQFWTSKIKEGRGSSSRTWKSISKLLQLRSNASTAPSSSSLSAESFMSSFDEKVETVLVREPA